MRTTMCTPRETPKATGSIEQDARRTLERLRAMERQNPFRERAEPGDNTPWADGLEALQDDMVKNGFLSDSASVDWLLHE